VAALGLLLLTGCNLTITNLTSDVLRENPSQLYTLTVRVKPTSRELDHASVQVSAVIDGQNLPMRKSTLAGDVYECDYAMPDGSRRSRVLFPRALSLQHQLDHTSYEAYSDIWPPQDHPPLCHAARPGPRPGRARVSLIGRGFTPQDVVYLDTTPARTVFDSPVPSVFYVPPSSPTVFITWLWVAAAAPCRLACSAPTRRP